MYLDAMGESTEAYTEQKVEEGEIHRETERKRDGKVTKKVQAIEDEGPRGAAEEEAQRLQGSLLSTSEASRLTGTTRPILCLMGRRGHCYRKL